MALREIFATTFVSLAFAGTALTTTATAATPQSAAAPCGFYESGSSAYYRHCGNTTVQIRVDYWNNTSGYECVGPNSTTFLGRSVDVDYAVYQRLC
ncbi:DUF6355 family natural product biosynthesis protein [Streptomyces parvulus]|uniref:DUF6355 family natural product biosynthesis protein n=1 Tax=Streptomyces parvulus TaxID=146923 RepID=UPI003449E08E